MSLKSVKNKITSIDKTRQVTRAMEAVSAVKMRKSQEQALTARPYAHAALRILQGLSVTEDIANHPLGTRRPVRKSCLIVVTSDRGLAGNLNNAVLKRCMQMLHDNELSQKEADIITIGSRGRSFFEKRGYTIKGSYEKWGDAVTFDDITPIIETIEHGFREEEYDDVWVVYTNFVSTLTQEVYARRVLPITHENVTDVVAGITPETGKFSETQETPSDETTTPIFEPSTEQVLETLIPALLRIQVYHSVLEANASEHSARMIAMKNASENAEELLKKLRLSYNKVRQAAITNEMIEIVGGMESLT